MTTQVVAISRGVLGHGGQSTLTSIDPSRELVADAYSLALVAESEHREGQQIDWASEAAVWAAETAEWSELAWPAASERGNEIV